MIEINLLPEEFRSARKSGKQPPYVLLAGVVAGIFVLVSSVLYFDFLKQKSELRQITGQWEMSQPEYKILQQLQADLDGPVRSEREFMMRFVTTQRPLYVTLMWLSECLPNNAWLTDLRLERGLDGEALYIRGQVIPSGKKTSIEQIEAYLQALKIKMPDARITLSTSRQEIDKVDVTQFVTQFMWGNMGKDAK
jgi:Tfp pilus assembly protein PilN